MCETDTIILSHWDKDHFQLGYKLVDYSAYARTWIAPQQYMTALASQVFQEIVQTGGEVFLWPFENGRVRHMRFPWGFVERGTRNDIANKNLSGLVTFVCVRGDRRGHRARKSGYESKRLRRTKPAQPGGPVEVTGPQPGVPLSPLEVRSLYRMKEVLPFVPVHVQRRDLHGANQDQVLQLALVLACALAGSQSAASMGVMPLRACANAAVAAARFVKMNRGCTWQETVVQLRSERALNRLRAHNHVIWLNVLQNLAGAAISAKQDSGGNPKIMAYRAGVNLTPGPGNNIPDAMWRRAVLAAVRDEPYVLRHDRPRLWSDHAPFTHDERYIVLNGDVDYGYTPSFARQQPPFVVGMTAYHHGAINDLSGRQIPWAPCAKEARVAFSVNRRIGGGRSYLALLARLGATWRRSQRKNQREIMYKLRCGASRAAHAAMATIYAIDCRYHNDLLGTGAGALNDRRDLRRGFVAATAAGAAAAYIHRDSLITALAMVLATTTLNRARDTVSPCLHGVLEAAKHGAEQHAAPTIRLLTRVADAGLDGDLLLQVLMHLNHEVRNHLPHRFTPANAGANAATIHQILRRRAYNSGLGVADLIRMNLDPVVPHPGLVGPLMIPPPGLFPTFTDVLNDIASSVVDIISITKRKHGSRRRSPWRVMWRALYAISSGTAAHPAVPDDATTRPLVARLRQQARQPYFSAAQPWYHNANMTGVGGADVALVDHMARMAGQLAAERVVSEYAKIPLIKLCELALTACDDGQARRASRVLKNRRKKRRNRAFRSVPSGRIVYSYGVDSTNGRHMYRKQCSGYAGHPNPIAIAKYEARGWYERRNTSDRARDLLGGGTGQEDLDLDHTKGHIAMQWSNDDKSLRRTRAGVEQRCGVCGKTFRYHR